MVDAVSLSGNSYRAATQALALRPAALAGETRAITPAPAVAQPPETVDDTGFLYAANGLPSVSAASANTVERSASVDTARPTPALLAIQSADLNAFMSSFLTARIADDGETSAHTVNQSMIARLYSQF